MAFTTYQGILAILMVFTGSINTLTTKWADFLSSKGSDGQIRQFDHPFVQACCMFFGEMLCLLSFKILYFWCRRKRDGSEDVHSLVKGNRDFNPFILFPPAMCDMIATSIMYVGLNLTYASSFQMLRGSVIIFVGVLSVWFLQRQLISREWAGIGIIIIGLIVVGMSDFLASDSSNSYSRNSIISGDLLIIMAQIITAIQMVYEERYVAGMDIPALQAIGWEGLFGFSVLSILLIPMYYIQVGPPFNNNAHGSLEDAIDGFTQIANNWQLLLSVIGTIISIAFFNFAGISVTKQISATTRMVLDSVRTFIIWMVSLGLAWQIFHWLQIIGFAGLLLGMCIYNNIILAPIYNRLRSMYIRRRYAEVVPDIYTEAPDDPVVR